MTALSVRTRWRRLAMVAVATLVALSATTTPATADAALDVTPTTTTTAVRGTTTTLTGLSVTGTTPSVSVTVSTSTGTLSVPVAQQPGLFLATGYSWSGTSEITFSGTASTVNAALAALQLAVSGSTTIGTTTTIGLAARPSGDSVTYNPDNGHYYQYVAGSVTWGDARAAALTRTYAGLTGYLVTITSNDENELVRSRIPNATNVWIGAHGTQTAPRVWTWVDGPEAGQNFTQCSTEIGACDFSGGTGYRHWASGEPNNWQPGGENSAVTNWLSANGLWNDLPEDATSYGIHGYVVEYGGGGGTSTLPSTSSTVTVVDVPAAPASVTAVADTWVPDSSGSTSVTVSLPTPSGNGLGITGYQYSLDGSTWVDASASDSGGTVTFQVTGLSPGSTYTVRARAVSSAGPGPGTSAASVRLPAWPTVVTFTRPLIQVGTAVSATFSADGYPAPTFSVTALAPSRS